MPVQVDVLWRPRIPPSKDELEEILLELWVTRHREQIDDHELRLSIEATGLQNVLKASPAHT